MAESRITCRRQLDRMATTTSAAQLRKIKKPMIERRRRERINDCLNQLKSIVLEATDKDESQYSKMEKADILEMTVAYLRTVRRRRRATTTSAAAADSTDHRLPIVAMEIDAESPVACPDNQRIPDCNRQRYAAGYIECATLVERYLTDIGSSLGPDVANVTSTIGDRLTQHLMISSPTCAECLDANGRVATAAGQLRTAKCHHRCVRSETKALSPPVDFPTETPTAALETKPITCDSCYAPTRTPPDAGAPLSAAFPCRRDRSAGSSPSPAARCAAARRCATSTEVNTCGDGEVSTTDRAAVAPAEDSSDRFVAGKRHTSAAAPREGNCCIGRPAIPPGRSDRNALRASPPEDDVSTCAVWRPWADVDQ